MSNLFRSLVIVLALLQAGWMTFDGTRAFLVGDYVTPSSGEYAGQLGPWAKVVASVGIEPRSSLMKSIFVIYGVAWLIIISNFALNQAWGWLAMLIVAIGTLWYLPFGTISSIIQIVLLVAIRKLQISKY